jgi:hypothetical protein
LGAKDVGRLPVVLVAGAPIRFPTPLPLATGFPLPAGGGGGPIDVRLVADGGRVFGTPGGGARALAGVPVRGVEETEVLVEYICFVGDFVGD